MKTEQVINFLKSFPGEDVYVADFYVQEIEGDDLPPVKMLIHRDGKVIMGYTTGEET